MDIILLYCYEARFEFYKHIPILICYLEYQIGFWQFRTTIFGNDNFSTPMQLTLAALCFSFLTQCTF